MDSYDIEIRDEASGRLIVSAQVPAAGPADGGQYTVRMVATRTQDGITQRLDYAGTIAAGVPEPDIDRGEPETPEPETPPVVPDEPVSDADYRYSSLEHATRTSPVSPVKPQPGDIVRETAEVPGVPLMRAVVRMPVNPERSVHQVPELSDDPAAAWNELRMATEAAAEGNIGTLRLPKGRAYHLANPVRSTGTHWPMDGLIDTVVDLNGCTLILDNVAPGITLSDSARVKYLNGRLLTTHILATGATVVADARPGSHAGVMLQVLPEFRAPLEAHFARLGNKPQLETIGRLKSDPKGGYMYDAVDSSDIFTNRGKTTDNWTYDQALNAFVSTSKTSYKVFPYNEGDTVMLLHENNAGHGFVFKEKPEEPGDRNGGRVEDISFENFKLVNIPGMAFSGEICRGAYLTGMTVEKDYSNPLSILGSSSDGVHFNGGGDIIVEDCNLLGSADDQFTAKANWWAIGSITGTTLLVGNAGTKKYGVNQWGRHGDVVLFIDEDIQVIGQATIVGDTQEVKNVPGLRKAHQVVLDNVPAGVTTSTLIANRDKMTGRLFVTNNRMENSRAQGVKLQARYAYVAGNDLKGIAGPGAEINFSLEEDRWFEAVFTDNLCVIDNTMIDVAVGRTKPPEQVRIIQKDGQGRDIQIMRHLRIDNGKPSGGGKPPKDEPPADKPAEPVKPAPVTGGGDTLPSLGRISVFPGVQGHGASFTTVRGAPLRRVTTLDDSGTGSLRAVLEDAGPASVVFDIGGLFTISDQISPTSDKVVYGGSAPGGGICISMSPSVTKSPIVISTENIALEHMRFRCGAVAPAKKRLNNNQNNIKIVGRASNIILNHLSLGQATDQQVVIWDEASHITIANSLIALGLHRSTHSEALDQDGNPIFQAHSMGLHADTDREPDEGLNAYITLYRNALLLCGQRAPWVGMDMADLVNNVVLRTGSFGMELSLRHGKRRMNIIRNLVLDTVKSSIYPASIKYSMNPGSIYAEGNIGPTRTKGDPESDYFGVGVTPCDGSELFFAATPHEMGYALDAIEADEALVDAVIQSVGAMPWARDAIDADLMIKLRAREGELMDCYGGAQVTPHNQSCKRNVPVPEYTGGPSRLADTIDGIPDSFKDRHGVGRGENGLTKEMPDGWTLFGHWMSHLSSGQVQEHLPEVVTKPRPVVTAPSTSHKFAQGMGALMAPGKSVSITKSHKLQGVSGRTIRSELYRYTGNSGQKNKSRGAVLVLDDCHDIVLDRVATWVPATEEYSGYRRYSGSGGEMVGIYIRSNCTNVTLLNCATFNGLVAVLDEGQGTHIECSTFNDYDRLGVIAVRAMSSKERNIRYANNLLWCRAGEDKPWAGKSVDNINLYSCRSPSVAGYHTLQNNVIIGGGGSTSGLNGSGLVIDGPRNTGYTSGGFRVSGNISFDTCNKFSAIASGMDSRIENNKHHQGSQSPSRFFSSGNVAGYVFDYNDALGSTLAANETAKDLNFINNVFTNNQLHHYVQTSGRVGIAPMLPLQYSDTSWGAFGHPNTGNSVSGNVTNAAQSRSSLWDEARLLVAQCPAFAVDGAEEVSWVDRY